VQPSYDDVAVIGYNVARTPGRGSAIFLHVTHHSATSGCVALPRPEVLTLLRWLNPKDHARIIMGQTATVTR
jgi:L,D-peptidoglycan transpeptidase YkuD (ErfK/YbiS/YcfS/YnhG family)